MFLPITEPVLPREYALNVLPKHFSGADYIRVYYAAVLTGLICMGVKCYFIGNNSYSTKNI